MVAFAAAPLRGFVRKVTAMCDDALAPARLTLAQFRLCMVELDRSTVGRDVGLLQTP